MVQRRPAEGVDAAFVPGPASWGVVALGLSVCTGQPAERAGASTGALWWLLVQRTGYSQNILDLRPQQWLPKPSCLVESQPGLPHPGAQGWQVPSGVGGRAEGGKALFAGPGAPAVQPGVRSVQNLGRLPGQDSRMAGWLVAQPGGRNAFPWA